MPKTVIVASKKRINSMTYWVHISIIISLLLGSDEFVKLLIELVGRAVGPELAVKIVGISISIYSLIRREFQNNPIAGSIGEKNSAETISRVQNPSI